MVAFHVSPKKHLNSIQSKGLIPKIGPRAKLLGESNKSIYLFPSKDDVDTALMNWLGDELDDEDIIIMVIDLAGIDYQIEGYEIILTEVIDPSRIMKIMDEEAWIDYTRP